MKLDVAGRAVAAPRSGGLVCLCPQDGLPPEVANDNAAQSRIGLAIGFALAVLAQTLAAGMLPLAGLQLTAAPWAAALPYAALLLGAAAASVPASFLLDGFGRRTAFAVGASLAIAGGLLVAIALLQRNFAWLCLGGFWLGVAQGFGLFYRHAAAFGADPRRRSAAIGGVFAAGALAGIAGPSLATFAEQALAPYTLVGTALLAAGVGVAGLATAIVLPAEYGGAGPAERPAGALPLWPTLLAAAAWFAMSAQMTFGPMALADCGVATGAILGVVAWHVVAMYAPAAFGGVLGSWLGSEQTGALGILLTGAGLLLGILVRMPEMLIAGTVMVGAGWSIATVAATDLLHRGGPSRLALGGHDAAILLAALAGALLGGVIA